MSCSPFDLRDYLLQELTGPQRTEVEAHVHSCPSCRLEMERLRLTQTALASLADEEMPRRIGFVSDQVFAVSPWRRWWAAFWGSAARLGFASAAMLSVALIVFATSRAAPAPRVVETVTGVSDAEVQQRLDSAVQRASAAIEARYLQRTEQLVKDIELRDRAERGVIRAQAQEQIDFQQRLLQAAKRSQYVASTNDGGPR